MHSKIKIHSGDKLFMATNPFSDFGNQLKVFREKAKESIAEVSGAVEVDTHALADIEAGKTQPSEDIVLLLISHFALKDDEALKMWELAGYDQQKTGMTSMINNTQDGTTQAAYVSAGDARIMYTDMVHVNANRYGVIINFLQGLGSNNQPMAVSRIGMSHEHAQSLLDVLQETLKLAKEQAQKDPEQS
jgi:DNA-binding XRE family transcriptional regulator